MQRVNLHQSKHQEQTTFIKAWTATISWGSKKNEDEENKEQNKGKLLPLNRMNIYQFESQDDEPKGTWPKSTNSFSHFYSIEDIFDQLYIDREIWKKGSRIHVTNNL